MTRSNQRRMREFHATKADAEIADVHKLRLAGIRAGTWPAWNFDAWNEQAAYARRRLDDHLPISPSDRRAIEIADALEARRLKGTKRKRTAA